VPKTVNGHIKFCLECHGMGRVLFQHLSASEAEQVVAGIWLSVERYGLSDPLLRFQFHNADDLLSICVEFERESYDVFVFGRPVEGHDLCRPNADGCRGALN
jgi:hypothetical protein